jgi:hypothetical protein
LNVELRKTFSFFIRLSVRAEAAQKTTFVG